MTLFCRGVRGARGLKLSFRPPASACFRAISAIMVGLSFDLAAIISAWANRHPVGLVLFGVRQGKNVVADVGQRSERRGAGLDSLIKLSISA